MVILILTIVDIVDLSFFVATNWIFLNDIPNRLFNNIIEADTGSIEDKIADTVFKMINNL